MFFIGSKLNLIKEILEEIWKKVSPFCGLAGWECKKWLDQLEHICEVQKAQKLRLRVFTKSLEGETFQWWSSVSPEAKENWQVARVELLEEFIPDAT